MTDMTTRQWITVIVLVYVNLINYMDRLTIAGILDDVKKEFNVNNAMGGFLQTAFIVPYMIFAPLFGYLGDRYNRKAILASGVFLWSLFTLIGSFMSGRPEHLDKQWSNPDFWSFLGCRAMVGIGEASYSTIAPTIISDMFVKNMRSKILALFYFAVPVGSGLGYIVGSETAKFFGDWQWGLRATPVLGIVGVFLILVFLMDPPRGTSEGHQDMKALSYNEDIISLAKNKSFVFSTLAFTSITFCTGALSWWGPVFIVDGLKTIGEEDRGLAVESVPIIFGAITMSSGVVGVPLGMMMSTKLKAKYSQADPVICAFGILVSALFLSIGMVLCNINIFLALIFLFIGLVALNLNWSIVADMLLYIVSPTCRSTAKAMQMLISHALGDAGSSYLIGLMSDQLLECLSSSGSVCPPTAATEDVDMPEDCTEEVQIRYRSLQYSLLSICGVEVVGGFLFLITAIYILEDQLASGNKHHDGGGARMSRRMTTANSHEDIPGDEMPKLTSYKFTNESVTSSSRSPTPMLKISML